MEARRGCAMTDTPSRPRKNDAAFASPRSATPGVTGGIAVARVVDAAGAGATVSAGPQAGPAVARCGRAPTRIAGRSE